MKSSSQKQSDRLSRWPWHVSTEPVPPTMPDGSAWPRITVITVSLNQAPYLEECLRSIVNQGYPNLEYIVIDGGSSDGSVEIIKRYEKSLTHWESSRDRGQADALNKGLARATGEILNFINSDDCLLPGALVKAATQMKTNDLLAGGVRYVWNELDNPENVQDKFNEELELRTWMKGGSSYYQQGVWLRTEILRKAGLFHTPYRYIFDVQMMLRILAAKPRVGYTKDVFTYFRLHSDCKSVGESIPMQAEFNRLVYDLLDFPNASLKKLAKLRVRNIEWQALLQKKEKSARFEGKWRLFWGTMADVLKDPSVRFSRFTFGFLRRVFRGPQPVDAKH